MTLNKRVGVYNAGACIACCLSGIAQIQISAQDVQAHLRAGELIEVLPSCGGVHADDVALSSSAEYVAALPRVRRLARSVACGDLYPVCLNVTEVVKASAFAIITLPRAIRFWLVPVTDVG